MNYVLDTSVLIQIRKGNMSFKDAISKVIDVESGDVYITLITFSEYYYGCLTASKMGQEDCLNFLNAFKHLTLTKAGAILYARLKHKYKEKGLPVSPLDLLIAALTIDAGMMLITLDRGFAKIEELKKVFIEV